MGDSPQKRDVKLVIVMRKDLNMRKGKMVAQGAHAALGAVANAGVILGAILTRWNETGTKKICVGVESEEELFRIYEAAIAARMPVHLVTDAGLTEFDRPTNTCLAIGPWYEDRIDEVTGSLKLL